MILLVNSEVANIGSWENILREKQIKYILSSDYRINLDEVTKIIFPGIGNFAKVMKNLENFNFKSKLIHLLKNNIPYLGICVGMQILLNESEGEKGVEGLGIIDGKCLKIKSKKITKPHNGWNNIKIDKKSALFEYFDLKSDLYFNHSYYCHPYNKEFITSYLNDDNEIITSIQNQNIYGVQFHPEKSQIAGNIIINNFLNL